MSNDIFTINAEEDTPFVSMERKPGRKIVIKGLSMPENVLDFYDPLSEKIYSFFDGMFEDIDMEISLQYMNSMSNKQLLKLLRGMSLKDKNLKITWKYNPNDDLIKLKGEEIKSIFPDMNFTLEAV